MSKRRELTAEEAAAADVLRDAWQRSGKSQGAVAEELGKTQGAIWQWVNGKLPVPADQAQPLALIINADPKAISVAFRNLFVYTTPDGQPPDPRLRPIVEWKNSDELDPNQHVILPRLEVHLSAGNGDGPRDSEPAAYNAGQAYRADFVKRKGWSPKTHFSMYVKGDSMEPTIPDGSVVVIDISDKRIRSGSIYAVKVDDELRLKRLHKLPGGIVRVESDNPAPRYKAFEVGGETAKGFKVIGRAVNLTTDL